jgi:hypothetical protein
LLDVPSSSTSGYSARREFSRLDREAEAKEADPSSSGKQRSDTLRSSVYGKPTYIAGVINGAIPLGSEIQTKKADPPDFRSVLTNAAVNVTFAAGLNKLLNL